MLGSWPIFTDEAASLPDRSHGVSDSATVRLLYALWPVGDVLKLPS